MTDIALHRNVTFTSALKELKATDMIARLLYKLYTIYNDIGA